MCYICAILISMIFNKTIYIPYRITLFELTPPSTIGESRRGYSIKRDETIKLSIRTSRIDGKKMALVSFTLPSHWRVEGEDFCWLGDTVSVEPKNFRSLLLKLIGIKKTGEDGCLYGIQVERDGVRIDYFEGGGFDCSDYVTIPKTVLQFKGKPEKLRQNIWTKKVSLKTH